MGGSGSEGDQMNNLDFHKSLNDFINEQGYNIRSKIGLNQKDGSLSVLLLSGGSETKYMDGSKDKVQPIQIICKIAEGRHDLAIILMNDLSIKLEELQDLPSSNDSYEFNELEITSQPSFLAEDDKGNVLYSFTLNADLYIKN